MSDYSPDGGLGKRGSLPSRSPDVTTSWVAVVATLILLSTSLFISEEIGPAGYRTGVSAYAIAALWLITTGHSLVTGRRIPLLSRGIFCSLCMLIAWTTIPLWFGAPVRGWTYFLLFGLYLSSGLLILYWLPYRHDSRFLIVVTILFVGSRLLSVPFLHWQPLTSGMVPSVRFHGTVIARPELLAFNANAVGILAVLGFISVVALQSRVQTRLGAILVGIATVGSLAYVITTFSRTATMAWLVAASVLMLAPRRWRLGSALLGVAVVALMAVLLGALNKSAYTAAQFLVEKRIIPAFPASSAYRPNPRWAIWGEALGAWWKSPRTLAFGAGVYERPLDSTLINMVAGIGLGGVLLLCWCAVEFRVVLRRIRRRIPREDWLALVACISAIVTFSLFVDIFAARLVLVPASVLVALLAHGRSLQRVA